MKTQRGFKLALFGLLTILLLGSTNAHASLEDELARGLFGGAKVDIDEEIAVPPPAPKEAPCADKPGTDLSQLVKAAKVSQTDPNIVGAGCKMFRGLASSYGVGDNLMGNPTTSEEPLDGHRRTAAMKFFRYGDKPMTAKVYCGDAKPFDVRVNDRGPVPKSRVIDLSPASARACGMKPGYGVKQVSVVVCFDKAKGKGAGKKA